MMQPSFEQQRRGINEAYERWLPYSAEGRAILAQRQSQALPGGSPESGSERRDGYRSEGTRE
jgi:hypothetical protein